MPEASLRIAEDPETEFTSRVISMVSGLWNSKVRGSTEVTACMFLNTFKRILHRNFFGSTWLARVRSAFCVYGSVVVYQTQVAIYVKLLPKQAH